MMTFNFSGEDIIVRRKKVINFFGWFILGNKLIMKIYVSVISDLLWLTVKTLKFGENV